MFGSLDDESLQSNPLFFGREISNDAILVVWLKSALVKLNPNVGFIVIQEAIDELTRDRSTMTAIAANEVVYELKDKWN